MRRVPFSPNTKDNTHCYQAALGMVLAHFFPNRKYSYEKLDKLTGKKKGLWTWPLKGIFEMKRLGLEIRIIENFDLKEFAKEGKSYLIKRYGSKVADEQDQHGDIESARKDASELLEKVAPENRIPDLDDVKKLLDDDCLIVVNINSKKLNRKKGYVGHFVVIYKITDKMIFMHDPGLPPRRCRRVTKRVFNEAWAYPNARARNLTAYKLG